MEKKYGGWKAGGGNVDGLTCNMAEITCPKSREREEKAREGERTARPTLLAACATDDAIKTLEARCACIHFPLHTPGVYDAVQSTPSFLPPKLFFRTFHVLCTYPCRIPPCVGMGRNLASEYITQSVKNRLPPGC